MSKYVNAERELIVIVYVCVCVWVGVWIGTVSLMSQMAQEQGRNGG